MWIWLQEQAEFLWVEIKDIWSYNRTGFTVLASIAFLAGALLF